MKPYIRFAAMIFTATVVMYGLMYLNTAESAHVRFSESRLYMALYMGACMAVIMLSFMWPMHKSVKANVGVYMISAIVFGGALWLDRSQTLVRDVSYMRAMIPHHSVAILRSERAQIKDARVRDLADRIIKSQREEISEMNALIADLSSK